ncbi:MAG: GxxExxY protein, partial [Chlamydiota bacterium]|nr:GxxExxY protein [Chlamydiota bacterium]
MKFNENQFKLFEQDNQDSLRLQDRYFLEHSDLTEIIFDSCFNVMNDLGVGFIEAVYKNSLVVSLRRKNLLVETEKKYEIFYQNQRVGFYIADIVVNESVIIEVKCCKELAPQHS